MIQKSQRVSKKSPSWECNERYPTTMGFTWIYKDMYGFNGISC
jgi:hypothetical protein